MTQAASPPLKIAAYLLRIAALVALVTATVGWARLAPWRAIPRATAAPAAAPALTDINQWGVNTFLASEVEQWKREKTLDMVAAAGIGWIKQPFAWSEIEPQQGVFWDAKYNQDAWKKYDDIVGMAQQRGIRVIARLDQTPAWARAPGTAPATPPTDLKTYGDFVEAFVRHFQGRVTFLQIWNEPNLAAEWGGRVDPGGYAQMLQIAAARARAVDPRVVIMSAPLAMTNENSARAWNELRYWQALYDRGAGAAFDIMTANAYGLDRSYDDPPSPDVLNFRRLELLRDLEVRNGDAAKPIWLDEYGWNAAPASFTADQLPWARVTDEQQAAWTVAGVRYARAHWPWLGVANIWYFRQTGDIPTSRADYYFRMVDVEFAPRDVYSAVQAAARADATAGVGDIGDLDGAMSPIGPWQIVRDAAASNGEYSMGGAGARMLVRFSGSTLTLDLAGAASNGTLLVRVSSDSRPPSDDAPPAQMSLSPNATRVTVVGNDGAGSTMAPRQRVAEIEVGPDSLLALDGARVAYARSYQWALGALVLFAVAAVGSVAVGRPRRMPERPATR